LGNVFGPGGGVDGASARILFCEEDIFFSCFCGFGGSMAAGSVFTGDGADLGSFAVSGVSLEAILPSSEAVLLFFPSRLRLRFFLACTPGEALSPVSAICAMTVLSLWLAASHILALSSALLMRPGGQPFPCWFGASISLPCKLRWL
jgi:hypothetical protein